MSSGAQSSSMERMKNLFAERNYDILGEVGRGGMGVVYLANDSKLDRKVALKTLSPDRANKENSIRRFEREAKTFGKIRHDHIATLYEFGDAGPIQYLALEYINGFDLEKERRAGRKWKAEEAVPVIISVAKALAYTHKKGILHRDIKPGNILIEQGTNRTVLTDFGLAKGKTDESLTAAGFAVGTPAYMAPEQISDQFEVEPDGRSDIFSLGTVFYEMLTNEHPFIGPDDLKTMRAIVQTPHKKVHELEDSIPVSLSKILDKMLEKHPEDRYVNCDEVFFNLEEWVRTGGNIGVISGGGEPDKLRDSHSSTGEFGSATPDSNTGQPTPATDPPEQAPGKKKMNPTLIVVVLGFIAMLIIGVVLGGVLFGK